MALGKQIPTVFGVDASYWRIGVLNIHPRSASVQVVLDGYVSAQHRLDGAAPVGSQEMALTFSPALADGGREAVYIEIKASAPEWADAEDV